MADSQKYGRSANLFDDEIESGFYNDNGELVPDTTTSHSTTYIPVNGTTYTASGLWNSGGTMSNFAVYEWDNDKNWLRRSNRQYPPSSNEITFTIGTDTAYITLQVQTEHDSIMLNTGSTALPYQPYYDWLHSLRKLTTATEAVENPLYSDGTAITSYTISGNTVQNDTPTPSNPVDVNGVGVRTINIYDGTTSATNARLSTSGTGTYAVQGWSVSSFIPIKSSTNYCTNLSTQSFYCLYDENKGFLVGGIISKSNPSPGIYANAKFMRFDFPTNNLPEVQLSEGVSGQDYEPYGYKIPISSPVVTTNIDLGSTQTVRQIKKYVMTGNETISNYASDFQRYVITIPTIPSIGTRLTPIICTHYIGIYDGRPAEQVPMNAIYTGSATDNSVLIKTDQTTDRSTFIAWLQEQYANGTPVTVWYVLATPETGIVNEPLMKIGEYADTLSNAASIPTTGGANSITVDTTVQPSEFTATWTGWHNAYVKEWDGSQWNE